MFWADRRLEPRHWLNNRPEGYDRLQRSSRRFRQRRSRGSDLARSRAREPRSLSRRNPAHKWNLRFWTQFAGCPHKPPLLVWGPLTSPDINMGAPPSGVPSERRCCARWGGLSPFFGDRVVTGPVAAALGYFSFPLLPNSLAWSLPYPLQPFCEGRRICVSRRAAPSALLYPLSDMSQRSAADEPLSPSATISYV